MSILVKQSLRGSVGIKDKLAGRISLGTILRDDTQTYILVDENGNEVPAVLVDEEVVLTATTNDIRAGFTAVNDAGVVTGVKEIPSYNTHEGYRIITAGKPFKITTSKYKYTKLQAVICAYNTTLNNSVAVEKTAINNNVYAVLSTESISAVIVDDSNMTIDFGIYNDSDFPKIIRFFYYKEEY